MKSTLKQVFTATLITFLGTLIFTAGASIINVDNYNPLQQWFPPDDTTNPDGEDTIDLPLPFNDYTGNPFEETQNSGLFLGNPSNVKSSVQYDPATNTYIFSDSIGQFPYRRPTTLTLDEYRQYEFDQAMQEYWDQRFSASVSSGKSASFIDSLDFSAADVLQMIDIKPSGSADLTFGLNINNIENPNLSKRLQRSVTFDFDEQIQMGVVGSIGDKIRVGIKYDTKAMFEFENETKLGYQGKEDEILRLVEFGNVSLPLTGTLISGGTGSLGIKTQLQFGKLTVTSIALQQNSETKTVNLQGGAQVQEFDIRADLYEGNRHFFLSHYFKDHYEKSLQGLPILASNVNINKIEVWVTNKTGDFEEARNIFALLDLAEGFDTLGNPNFYAPANVINPNPNQPYPVADQAGNPQTNGLYNSIILEGQGIRNIYNITATMATFMGGELKDGRDFEKIENARLLSETEYTYNPQLGYISLRQALNADEVLAVAFQYTVGGEVYQVGEFSNGSQAAPNTLVLKLLKGTNFSPALPNWELMMKNVYSLNSYQISAEEFDFHVYYHDDITGQDLNYYKGGSIISDTYFIKMLNLDNTNMQGQPGSDSRFDFLNGVTIDANSGRIFFPVLEPFGESLRRIIDDDIAADKIVFEELYDSTQNKAQQIASKNKFYLKGSFRSASSSEIYLGPNIPEGSVKVTCGGQVLQEGADFIVDYAMGRVTITNQSYTDSGKPIQVSAEAPEIMNMNSKTLLGTHLDYHFSDNFVLSSTIMNLNERPLTDKVNIGNEPFSNTIWGFNGAYNMNAPFLTRFVDKYIPLINTKEPSSIVFEGEYAQLIPGSSRQAREGGVSYIDDFEGSETAYTLKDFGTWGLASTPQGQPALFPEGELNNSLAYGFNRGRLAWYHVSSDLVRKNSSVAPGYITSDDKSDHRVREVIETDIFPNLENEIGDPPTIQVLNLAYYPTEKGPYNFDVDGEPGISEGIDQNGNLMAPETRWAGIMRRITQNDFETANIEYIEFWVMDPFEANQQTDFGSNATLYFNLGNISEDILRDSRKSFEQGYPITNEVIEVDSTVWGRVPVKPSLTRAFDNNTESRTYQDVGLDGLIDTDEAAFFSSQNPISQNYPYLDLLREAFGETSIAYQKAAEDPAGDNYHYFNGGDFDDQQISILERYKKYNNYERNSPTEEQNPEQYPTSGTTMPDVEDINEDNTLSENESYFQYSISIRPEEWEVGKNYITDIVVDNAERANGEITEIKWYQFRIPVLAPEQTIGSISDFKSIRFMRMFLAGVDKELVLRFAKLELVRGEWRNYATSIQEGGESGSWGQIEDESEVNITSVNIEENSARVPINYILPPGVSRLTDPMQPQQRKLNEQAMVFKVTNLQDGTGRASYKNVNIDMRQYGKLEMFVHAEKFIEDLTNLQSGELVAFIRIGTDYTDNYYEYQVPLTLTDHGVYADNLEEDRLKVWPEENRFDIETDIFLLLKQNRNDEMRMANSTVDLTKPYSMPDGDNKVVIVGNPNLSEVRTIMLGVYNPKNNGGTPKSGELWFNELRLTDFNDDGGWAANANIRVDIADFATVNMTGSVLTAGFGSIENRVNERSNVNTNLYDISALVNMGKFFPQRFGVQMPLYMSYSETFINPKYNPLDPDIPLDVTLNNPEISVSERDSIRRASQDYTMRKNINLTNVKITNPSGKEPETRPGGGVAPGGGATTVRPFYSPANLTLSYGFREEYHTDITTVNNLLRVNQGSIQYIFNNRPKNITPFAKVKFLKPNALKFIKEFNFFYAPAVISVRTDLNKRYQEVQIRDVNNPTNIIAPEYLKEFSWNREYIVKYNLAKSLKFDFMANNAALIYEPDGKIDKDADDYQQRRDSVMTSFFDFGENTLYDHHFEFNYNVPINKLPGLFWVNSTAKYAGDFTWQRGMMNNSREFPLGHTITNSNQKNASLQFNFQALITRAKPLKDIATNYTIGDNKKPPVVMEDVMYEKIITIKAGENIINHNLGTEQDVVMQITDEQANPVDLAVTVVNKDRISFTADTAYRNATVRVTGKKPKTENPIVVGGKYFTAMLLGLRNVSVNYTENNGTILPGYMNETRVLGLSQIGSMFAPGFPFIAGFQDEDFGYRTATENAWLSDNELMNTPSLMNHTENFDVRATLEPIKGFKIDVSANRNITENNSEYYLYDIDQNMFTVNNTSINGNFRISYNFIKTSFWKIEEGTYRSEAFELFKENRVIIAQRLAMERESSAYQVGVTYDRNQPNVDAEGNAIDAGGHYGYPLYAQEVLLPAFLAAYSGKSAGDIGLSPFPKIPFPNWRITYDGLGKIEMLKEIFNSVNLTHVYTSTYNVGSYQNNPMFDFTNAEVTGYSWVTNELNSFIPREEIAGITISEQFAPLVGVDVVMKNSINAKVEYGRKRDMQMSFNNNQLAEATSQMITLGLGYKIKEFPFEVAGRQFKSDIDFRADFRIERSLQVLHKLIEDLDQASAGFTKYTFGFYADYKISEQFDVRFFIDRDVNKPVVQTAFPTANTKIGFTIRFSLVPKATS